MDKITLRKARKLAGVTQDDLAAVAGVARTDYNRIERGRQQPTLDTALRIIDALRAAGLSGIAVEDVDFAADTTARNADTAA